MRLIIHKKQCSHALEQTNAPGVGVICASSALLFLLAKVQLSTPFTIGSVLSDYTTEPHELQNAMVPAVKLLTCRSWNDGDK